MRRGGGGIPLSAETGGEFEQRLVMAAGGGQLHSADGAGDGDRGYTGETEGRGVTQQTRACFAVVGSGG